MCAVWFQNFILPYKSNGLRKVKSISQSPSFVVQENKGVFDLSWLCIFTIELLYPLEKKLGHRFKQTLISFPKGNGGK